MKWMLGLLFFVVQLNALSIEEPAVVVITGEASQLMRPEGCAFSPDGEFLVVANSDGQRILMFRKEGDSSYGTEPVFVISGRKSGLNYPHDVAFSPDGEHLAVANRYGNAINIYRKNPKGEGWIIRPMQVIRGRREKLLHVGAVSYSPNENFLAVANTSCHNILIYAFEGDRYDTIPLQVIKGDFCRYPDGIDFSEDGELIAVTNHGHNTVALFQRDEVYPFSQEPVFTFEQETSFLSYPHSVAFHPYENILAISNAGGTASVSLFEQTGSATFDRVPTQKVGVFYEENIDYLSEMHPQECGAKGIAFSPDGRFMAVCSPDMQLDDRVLVYDLQTDVR